MFLTADGKPIVGGTYWPREDKKVEGETIAGFKTILNMMLEVWTRQAEGDCRRRPTNYAEQTADALSRGTRG